MPADRPVRVGIIGVGRHARQVLLPAIQCVPALELAGLCVRTARSQGELASAWSVPVVRHYEDLMTRDDLDAVIVATPSALHRYLVMDAVRCGKHVLCEAAGIVGELDIAQVAAAVQDTRAVVQYGHRFWYAPVYAALARAIEDFGRPGERRFRFVYPEATHLYGIAMLLNGPIRQVAAHGKEHACTYEVEFANGDRGVFKPLPGEPSPDSMAERVEVVWQGETLVAEGGVVLKRVAASGEQVELSRFEFDPAYAQDHTKMADGSESARAALRQRGYIPELESFVACIRAGARPVVGLEQAAAVFRLVWAMFESVGTGRPMTVRAD